MKLLRHRPIGFNRADTVDAGDRGDDDHVIAFKQGAGGRVAHPVDLLVNLALFFDIGVGAGDIGLWLVVVVVRDEIFDRVFGEKPLKLAEELRCEGFIGGQDDRRALGFLNDLGHREGFSGPGCAQQNLIAFAVVNAAHKIGNCGRLIARRLELCHHLKTLACFEFFRPFFARFCDGLVHGCFAFGSMRLFCLRKLTF